MAHNELLEALRLSQVEEDEQLSVGDNFSSVSGSPISAKSIPLDGPLSPAHPTSESDHGNFFGSERVQSPSIIETEVTSADSEPPTTRTSLTSQVPSLATDDLLAPKALELDTPSSYGPASSIHPDPLLDAMSSTITPKDIPPTSLPIAISSPEPPPMNRDSTASSTSSLGRKVRPDSLIVSAGGPLILGIALVDFNHSVGASLALVLSSTNQRG